MLRNTRLQNERGTISRSPLYWVTGGATPCKQCVRVKMALLTTPYTLASHYGPICTRHEKCAGIGQRRRTTSTFAEVEAVDKVCETCPGQRSVQLETLLCPCSSSIQIKAEGKHTENLESCTDCVLQDIRLLENGICHGEVPA